ncbi:helix-turn-helix domain-containing protein [Haloarcula sp. JP-L23]|uniref:helix-turn-helix transcriptional regulator n=1 Tax=Haloarcula sp. JP-L23 TaxID=2716717 RepID=UPI00140EDE1A|nr:helix-turn-helix domain-containing protein [Haloarcula sp. JP-L23]
MDDTGESENSGGRKPVVSDKQILELFIEADDPVVSAPELADELPISKTAVYKRLRDLDERGLIDSKKFGQGKAWWITEDGKEFVKSS